MLLLTVLSTCLPRVKYYLFLDGCFIKLKVGFKGPLHMRPVDQAGSVSEISPSR